VQTESAKMSSAAEARFRVEAQPPTTRTITVASLDPASDPLVGRLSARGWDAVTFFRAADVLRDVQAVAAADTAVMLAVTGADAHAAALVGQACSDRRVPTATFVLRTPESTEEALSQTLGQVRPWSLMVVVAGDEGYVEDILRSFR
jgi:hypothetical protein